MAVGVDRRAKKAATRLHQALLIHTNGEAMPENSPTTTSTSGSGPAYLPSLPPRGKHEVSDSGLSFAQEQQTNKKRRASQGTVPSQIRRASLTPHMRGLALSNAGELSPTAEKRRNKLGYHRTSVACGHCRRRKIRCLVANDDPHGRCSNCIRLKKECNFYPVDQGPPGPLSVKEGASSAHASATSSPRHPPSAFSVSSSSHPPTSRLALQTEAEMDSGESPISGSMNMQHPPYTFPPPIDTHWPTPSFLPSSGVAEAPSMSSGFWRPSEPAPNSTYETESSVSGAQTPATMHSTSNMAYGRSGDHHWVQPNIPPPTRSMSYGNIEGLPTQYANPGLGIQASEYSRRTSPYPYPIDTTASFHGAPLGSDTASAPLSAPIIPNQAYEYPPAWSQYPGMPPATHDVQGRSMSAQWSRDAGPLDKVQGENAPPVLYSQHYYPGS
ncbi:uncharacterized protein EI97DRAFT_300921 [Westerdykella ornata]|uniref:Zn(2)-C6 fungal-type domain-containing protein n=1 Tax=Westerdykella ornata TaxID=318751 RepID=A0A6A6JN40_WESOR|nr:uncharacterized protein EI97DRAFT_300921 [Westerdykella ornata]KAF2277664.1 hypothetical protein EI97DRAFT_300921 [Westerdykella ornata]